MNTTCFHGEIRKIFPQYPLLFGYILSGGMIFFKTEKKRSYLVKKPDLCSHQRLRPACKLTWSVQGLCNLLCRFTWLQMRGSIHVIVFLFHHENRVLTRILIVGVQDSFFIKSRSPSQKVGVPLPKNRSHHFFHGSPSIVSMSPVTSFYKYPMVNSLFSHTFVCVFFFCFSFFFFNLFWSLLYVLFRAICVTNW